ncbi:divergent polysaccharide deacetylase family protein [Solimonas sp. SE-A11]|uniref:divergent polysaccharide deacetylase family protein n=1 Tax=Solimonas sp. SE-A11 TaxID=3054954 RepID=UPI00259CD7EE|nr:divergent polysaccharide deacetylase family protein [Solimonas sp. SE-A11]
MRRLRCTVAALLLLPCIAGARAPAISIVIDDLGDRLAESRAAAELPGPVACAMLPESPYTPQIAALAQARGKEVMLHLPLQPGQGRGHPLTILDTASPEQRNALLQRALAAVPQAVGVNNHQGSRLTSESEPMRWLMQALREHGGLYFIDSRTSAATQAEAEAWQRDLPTTRRQVFLDNSRGAAALQGEWQRLLALARKNGTALAIGHPYPETLALLQREIPRLQAQGIRLIAPSALIREQGTSRGLRVAAAPLRLSAAMSQPGESPMQAVEQNPATAVIEAAVATPSPVTSTATAADAAVEPVVTPAPSANPGEVFR